MKESAENYLPVKENLTSLKKAANHCHGCHLYKYATQTVFGEGRKNSKLMIVGEIPGNKEDEIGKPFVGPAGIYLKKTIEKIGLNEEDVYFTNVVKHFKFQNVKNRRLHRSPTTPEIKACVPWLQSEIRVIKPKVILCLGLVAAKALIDKHFHIHEHRGKWYNYTNVIKIIATFHPSAILRAPDDTRPEIKKQFCKDIKKVAIFLMK